MNDHRLRFNTDERRRGAPPASTTRRGAASSTRQLLVASPHHQGELCRQGAIQAPAAVVPTAPPRVVVPLPSPPPPPQPSPPPPGRLHLLEALPPGSNTAPFRPGPYRRDSTHADTTTTSSRSRRSSSSSGGSGSSGSSSGGSGIGGSNADLDQAAHGRPSSSPALGPEGIAVPPPLPLLSPRGGEAGPGPHSGGCGVPASRSQGRGRGGDSGRGRADAVVSALRSLRLGHPPPLLSSSEGGGSGAGGGGGGAGWAPMAGRRVRCGASEAAAVAAAAVMAGPLSVAAWLPTAGGPPRRRLVAAAAAAATQAAAVAAGSTAGAGGAAAAGNYELPAHWREQMDKAPLGRKRVLQRYYADVIAINALEPEMRALSNAALRGKTAEFRRRLAEGTPLQSLRAEAFAVVREASRRVLGMRHYDCQLVGGMVLSEGQVAEMATGEGKTLVATLPGYLGALSGRGVHVVTVNDYLAARDAAWMGKLYRFLGLSCAAVQSSSSPAAVRSAFAADVTYVTGQELCFSYLRDNVALSPQDLTLRDEKFHFAIVDEVDSILIDESRNPMIIAGRDACDTRVVATVDRAVRRLWSQVQGEVASSLAAVRGGAGLGEQEQQRLTKGVKSRYYTVDEKSRTVSYTQTGTHLIFLYLLDEGAQFADPYPGVHSLWEEDVPWGRLAVTSMTAYELYVNGKDYIVRDGEAVIVDPSTGRLRAKTRWQGGIHQAVEAKEGLSIQAESLVTASVTFQLFFRQYEWLAGMTGTAQPAAAELYELYGIKVVPVPTNRPSRRTDHPPRLYYEKALKMHALAAEVTRAAEQQRPVLIGTTSVQESELVLHYLNSTVAPAAAASSAGGPKPRITLLNAKPELVRLEAQVIAQAGLPGAVTIATNMAGRGTDIILGGNPEGLTRLALMRLVYRRLLRGDERETLPELPLCQLDPYDTDDVRDLTGIPYATPDCPHSGLPRPLHETLATAVLIALASQPTDGTGGGDGGGNGGSLMSRSLSGSLDLLSGGGGGGGGGLSYARTAELLAWVMDRAEVLRRKVRGTLRRTYRDPAGGPPPALEKLNYTLCVAPVATAVLAEREAQKQDAVARRAAAADRAAAGEGGAGLAAAAAAAAAVGIGLGGAASPGASVSVSSFTDEDEAAAAAAAVAVAAAGDEDEEGEEPVAQVWALRAALHLWLWFDQECARYREDVRGAGGLLVIGTSLNESQRIELQLRGRAGRQGDPGETRMLLDCCDPLLVVFGMDRVSASLNSLSAQLQTGPDYLEGGPLNYFVSYVVRWQESMAANMRLETKRYDGVMEEYRRNLYTLRRLLLCGGDLQRGQIVYVLLQRYVDELVGRYLDPGQQPGRWLQESVPAGELPYQPGPAEGALVSPLQAVLHCLRVLVNPPGRTTKTLVDWSGLSAAAATNPTVRKMLTMMGVTQGAPGGGGGAGKSKTDSGDGGVGTGGAGLGPDASDEQYLPVHMQVEELELLSPDQLRSLAEYIAGTGPLEWTRPAAREVGGNFRLQLQLATHRALHGYGLVAPTAAAPTGGGTGAAGGGTAASAAAAEARTLAASRVGGLMQRPPLYGPSAEKVSVLRNYLGEVLIGAYEARRLAARLALQASPALGLTDVDAEMQLCGLEQQTLLQWLDALWSVFLEESARLRNAVAIRSSNGSNPLAEFRIEANAAFLALLDNYRDAVCDKLLVPDFAIYTPLEAEDNPLLGADMVGPGLTAGNAPILPPAAAAEPAAPTALQNGTGSGGGLGVSDGYASASPGVAAGVRGSGNGNGGAAAAGGVNGMGGGGDGAGGGDSPAQGNRGGSDGAPVGAVAAAAAAIEGAGQGNPRRT